MSAASVPPDLLPYLLGEKQDYSSAQSSIITVNVVFVALVCLTTGLRFWVRFGMLQATGPDDLLLVIAVIFALLLSTSCLVGHGLGLGKHIWNIAPHNLSELPSDVGRATKALYGCYLAYSTAIAFTKFSIMATYFRIFVPKSMLRKVVLLIAVLVLCLWITSIFAVIFTCIPVAAAWDYTITNARCIPIVHFFYASSAFNIATDLLLCFLPLPTLWALKMPVAQRVVLCILFSGGTFACISSILRLTKLHRLGGFDVTYQSVASLNWSVIEVDTAIICSSLSALRPLASRTVPKLFQHFSHPAESSPPMLTNSKLGSSHTSVCRGSWSKSPLQSPPPTSRIPMCKIPKSKFSTRTNGKSRNEGGNDGEVDDAQRKQSEGEIMVERTFDVTELAELPPVGKTLPLSPIVLPKRMGRKVNIGVFTDTARLFEKSSEEDSSGSESPVQN